MPSYDVILLIRDLNAQISNRCQGLNNVLGSYGTAKETNDNGEKLSFFCSNNGIKVVNTFFVRKQIHRRTWLSLDGYTENEIDYICISVRHNLATPGESRRYVVAFTRFAGKRPLGMPLGQSR